MSANISVNIDTANYSVVSGSPISFMTVFLISLFMVPLVLNKFLENHEKHFDLHDISASQKFKIALLGKAKNWVKLTTFSPRTRN